LIKNIRSSNDQQERQTVLSAIFGLLLFNFEKRTDCMKTFRNILPLAFILFLTSISFHSEAQTQTVDTIYVTDTFLRPGIQHNYTTPNGGGGNGESTTANELRVRTCINLRSIYAALSCSQKEVTAPTNVADLRIPGRYGDPLLWEDSVLAFAQRLFTNNPPTPNARTAAAEAVRAALTGCVGIVSCQNDVLLYFGINRTSIGSLGSLGDINAAYNDFLRQVGLGGTLDSSDAGMVIKRYFGLATCQGLQNLAVNPQNRCGTL
jgi:hypothetical protein